MIHFRPVWAEIDLGALKRNYRRICQWTGAEVMPVVKADAYGHGAVQVAGALREEGARRFGVACLEEALELKERYADISLMILGPTLPGEEHFLVREGIIPEVSHVSHAEALSVEAVRQGRQAKIHVKIDTGMGRIGFRETALKGIEAMSKLPGIQIEGIYTHLATADGDDDAYVEEQISRFQALLTELARKGLRIPVVHCANSAALLRFPQFHYSLCRPGLILYGLAPCSFPGAEELEPVCSWQARIVYLKTIAAEESVGYGRTFRATQATRVATLPLGYGDGLRRGLSNRGEVLVAGRRAPIIGRICMDQTMVDVSRVPGVQEGDQVTLLGRQGQENITAEEMAARLDTISYEILCGIGKRVPRHYLERRPESETL